MKKKPIIIDRKLIFVEDMKNIPVRLPKINPKPRLTSEEIKLLKKRKW